MVFINECYKVDEVYKPYIEEVFVKMLAPIAPHIGEELWSKLGHEESITYQPWPTYDEARLVDDEVEIVQVNGKSRAKIKIAKDTSKEEMQEIALSNDNVKASIEGKDIMKVIAVPQKLVNIVAK